MHYYDYGYHIDLTYYHINDNYFCFELVGHFDNYYCLYFDENYYQFENYFSLALRMDDFDIGFDFSNLNSILYYNYFDHYMNILYYFYVASYKYFSLAQIDSLH
jgi:hypothetical protein